jgi:hypothetical protein
MPLGRPRSPSRWPGTSPGAGRPRPPWPRGRRTRAGRRRPPVHVDVDRADVGRGDRGLGILEAVLQVEVGMLIRPDAMVDQPVRQPVGALLKVGIGALHRRNSAGRRAGHLVCHRFPRGRPSERADGRTRRHMFLTLCGHRAGILSSGPIGALVTARDRFRPHSGSIDPESIARCRCDFRIKHAEEEKARG